MLTKVLVFSDLRQKGVNMRKIEYLKRKIDDFLDAWKDNPEHKSLIVRGARQGILFLNHCESW